MQGRAAHAARGTRQAAPARVHVDGHAGDGVDDREGVGTLGLEGLGNLDDACRRHLHEQRALRVGAHGADHLGGTLGRGAHGATAGGDVGAADVDLETGGEGDKLLEQVHGAHVLVNGMAGNLADHLGALVGELLEVLAIGVNKAANAGVLKAHGVHHAARDLGHARRGIAGPGLGGAALRRDGAKAAHVVEALELPAKAIRAARGVDRVLHLDAAEVDGHVHLAHHATTFESKTGPAMQAPIMP